MDTEPWLTRANPDLRAGAKIELLKLHENNGLQLRENADDERPKDPVTRQGRRHPAPDCPTCGRPLISEEPHEHAAKKIEWTCPMHPEIMRDAPGNCPICGMALEPRTISAEEEANPELVSMTRRFWTGVVLSVPSGGPRHAGHDSRHRTWKTCSASPCSPGSNWSLPRPSCSGQDGPFSFEAGNRL